MEKTAQSDATTTLSPVEDHQVRIERDDLWAVETVLTRLKKGINLTHAVNSIQILITILTELPVLDVKS